jgi:hypothetical protein
MKNLRVYTYEGIPMVHISAFASATSHDITSTRALLSKVPVIDGEGGQRKRRPLKYFRDRSTLWIPTAEIKGYPFTRGTSVYHYDDEGNRHLCEICTYTNEMCEDAKKADELVMPIGDI